MSLRDKRAGAAWQAWVARGAPEATLPAELLQLVLFALDSTAQRIEQDLRSPQLDADHQADLTNDLSFIHAIERDVRRETARAP